MGPTICRIPRAASLIIVCLLATLLPATQAQPSGSTMAADVHHVYFPLIGGMAPSNRLFLPLLVAGPSGDPEQNSVRPVGSNAARVTARGVSGFVTRQGEELQVNGEPYHFIGTNVSYLAGPFFPESEAEGIIAHLSGSGVQVIRVWVLPWNDLDRVERMLDLGRKYNIRFIVTLQDFYGNLDGSCFDRYETADLPHIRNVLGRFAQRSEVLLWELMNEPTCPSGDSSLACWDALYEWAQVTSREIKRLDPNHLVGIGTQNAGYDDQARGVFRRVHSLETIDLVGVHRQTGSLPDKELAIAHELDKPIYFGEVSMRGHSENCEPLPGDALERRAQAIADDLQDSLKAGVDGYLLWQYAYGGVDMGSHIEYFCGVFDYFADDPVWSVIKAATP